MQKNSLLLRNKVDFLKSTALVALPNISLSVQEADKFLDYVIDESFWQDNARIVRMDKNEKNLRTIGMDSSKKFLHPSATFSSSDYHKQFAEGKILLSSKKFRGCAIVYDDDLDDNCEGDAFADHIIRMVATQASNELDEFYYVCNTSSSGFGSTDIRHQTNGFRYNLLNFSPDSGTLPGVAHELDASSTGDFTNVGGVCEVSTGAGNPVEFKFKKMLKELPSKYKKKGLSNLRFFMNDELAQDYGSTLQDRGTSLGDKSIVEGAPAKFNGVPIAVVPQMPISYASGAAGTEEFNEGTETATYKYGDVVLTHRQNFVIGLHRSLKLETSREAADEATYFFYSIRVDCAIENPDGAVILVNVTH